MTRSGNAYRLPPSAPPTAASGSSSPPPPPDPGRVRWATPQAGDSLGGGQDPAHRHATGHAIYLRDQVSTEAGGGTLNPAWVETLQGFPQGWTDLTCDHPQPRPWPAPYDPRNGSPQHDWEPPRVISRTPDRAHRLKALGNAVVPACAELIGRQIIATHTTTHTTTTHR